MKADQFLAFLADLSGEDVLAVSEQHLSRAPAPKETASRGTVAIVPVTGVLVPRGMQGWLGKTPGMDSLRSQIASAAANSDVSAIVLDIDSPGGSVAGTEETALAVADAATKKPVVAVANTLAASAAYWIGSQATEFVVTPGSMAGSIGVISVHSNMAKMLDRMGIEMTLIRSGPRKAEGHPFGPLDDAARESMQQRVDSAATDFFAAVARGRKTSLRAVKEKFGSGAIFSAAESVENGLADRQATLDQVIADLSAGRGRAWKRRSALAFA
jgi:capsid assembly protease